MLAPAIGLARLAAAAEHDHVPVVEAAGPLEGVVHGNHSVPNPPGERIPVSGHHPPRRLDYLVALVHQVHGAPERDATLEQPTSNLSATYRVVPARVDTQ